MVVISGALCTVEDYVIMSQCAHNKAIHLAAEGTVSVTDISQTQNITIVGLPDFVNNDYKIALYAKETKRYLCFNENWKLVGMQELQDTCYFNETIVHGYFVFRSVVDLQRRIGFTHRGKAIGPKKNVSNDACYMFTKIQADQFFHQHRAKMMAAPTSSATMTASTTATTSYTASAAAAAAAATRTTTTTKKTHNKNNNNNRRYHNKNQNQSHLNGHNSNISNKNHTNLSNNTKQQQHHTREHVQRQHLVRHHHNDPNAIARRQHHEQKQKRRQQQQQQRARLRTTTTTTASPKTTTKIKNLTNTAATTPITTTTTNKRANTTRTTTTTTTTSRLLLKNKHKGRKRKIESTQKKHSHHKQRLLHKLNQQQRSQQYRTDAAMSTTARTTSTTQTDADWSMSENWWSNFTDDYNNNTYNNNTDYGSNEWLSVDPSPVSTMFSSTLVAANEVSDSEESLGYFSSSTVSSYLDPTKSHHGYDSASSTEPFESTPSDSNWSSTSYTSLDIDFDNNQDNSSSESDTMPTDIWSSATPVLNFSPTTKVTFKQAQKGAVIETTTSTNDNDNSTNQFDLFTDAENADNSSDLLSMSEASVATTLNSFVINKNQQTTKQQVNRRKLQRGRNGGSKSNKFVRKFAQPAATNAALTTKMHRASTPFLQTWSTKITTTPNPLNFNKINNIIQINKNISESQIHNSLSDKLEPSTRRDSFSTIATTKDKSVRKSTQKLLATPFHQLIQYVRNDAGEIDIDNIDNISIYPEVSEDSDIDYSAAQDSSIIMPHRRLAIVSGYLPTSASVVLPESIQIAKIKINKERKRLLRQRRRHGETDRILA